MVEGRRSLGVVWHVSCHNLVFEVVEVVEVVAQKIVMMPLLWS